MFFRLNCRLKIEICGETKNIYKFDAFNEKINKLAKVCLSTHLVGMCRTTQIFFYLNSFINQSDYIRC